MFMIFLVHCIQQFALIKVIAMSFTRLILFICMTCLIFPDIQIAILGDDSG